MCISQRVARVRSTHARGVCLWHRGQAKSWRTRRNDQCVKKRLQHSAHGRSLRKSLSNITSSQRRQTCGRTFVCLFACYCLLESTSGFCLFVCSLADDEDADGHISCTYAAQNSIPQCTGLHESTRKPFQGLKEQNHELRLAQ